MGRKKRVNKQSTPSTLLLCRTQFQSKVLTWTITPLLAFTTAYLFGRVLSTSSVKAFLPAFLISLLFALAAWLFKAATLPAAVIGFLVCMIITEPSAQRGVSPLHTALPALVVLVLLTFIATRFGRSKKETRRLAERQEGRHASQIIANLGVAALCSAAGWHSGAIAALAEAAADTASSEVGQAVGGPVWLLTSWRRVPTGTNGGVSITGSTAGIVAAALVVATGMSSGVPASTAVLLFAAACAGLFFDSLLGATLENRGWIGNDVVNLCSTAFAAAVAVLAIYLS
ncbi:MAG TPA: DUF92 domain-containing protein [Edaphobacter sp.]|nr:DUF92 domain-containing protein [Edaphobacter sp.]